MTRHPARKVVWQHGSVILSPWERLQTRFAVATAPASAFEISGKSGRCLHRIMKSGYREFNR